MGKMRQRKLCVRSRILPDDIWADFSDSLKNREHGASAETKQRILNSFAEYPFYVASSYWQAPPHIRLLSEKLQALAEGRDKSLMVCMPPRHGKSETASVMFPSWYLGKYPDRRIILASYGDALARTFSKRAKNILNEYGEDLFDVTVSGSSNIWDINGRRGGLVASGIGGAITGKGAHFLDIDDPVKNAEEANSATIRNNAWEWYNSTALTRLEPGGGKLLCLTRWNEDDVAGRILAQLEDDPSLPRWEVIRLPAIAEEDDPLGREPGEPLWPERYGPEALLRIKAQIGLYHWSALYQQRPISAEGSFFRTSYFLYFREESFGSDEYYVLLHGNKEERISKRGCWRFQTCDPAATENELSDFFVICTWAVTPNNDLLLLDVFRDKAETVKHQNIIRQQFYKWEPDYIGVENKTFGINILQEVRNTGIPVIPLIADRDKISRARVITARYEIGKVFHKAQAHWLQDYEGELLKFPAGAHDDQVDCAGYAGVKLAAMGETHIY